ncbi:MAG: L,D-transpeptidase [Bacilli bacterium]|nr:L,D-transpeptidase [Bacilli bacterium]
MKKQDMIRLIAAILLGCIIGDILSTRIARADVVMDSSISPAYAFMPQNVYHNTIYKKAYGEVYLDKCKNPGTVVKIVVDKSAKTMQLLDVNGCVVKQYNVVTGKNPGPKQCDGDKRTPEGTYRIVEKRDSKYHKFLALDYPRAKDIKKAKELGCKPGDSIGIHAWIEGLPMNGSLGCIRVKTKEEILEVNRLVRVGTTVEILP